MKILFPMVVLLALVVVPGSAWSGISSGANEVGVRALVKSPEAYNGQIRVAGVVSQVAAETKMFGLIDLEEFKTCKKVTCASLVLPVQWDGPMPEVGQQLDVVGEIKKDGERYLFNASKVEPASGK